MLPVKQTTTQMIACSYQGMSNTLMLYCTLMRYNIVKTLQYPRSNQMLLYHAADTITRVQWHLVFIQQTSIFFLRQKAKTPCTYWQGLMHSTAYTEYALNLPESLHTSALSNKNHKKQILQIFPRIMGHPEISMQLPKSCAEAALLTPSFLCMSSKKNLLASPKDHAMCILCTI